MYLSGTGLPQDSKKAMSLIRAATNFGSTDALVFLGRAYLGLQELPEDAILEGGRHNVAMASQCFAKARYVDPSIQPPPELEEMQVG
jgi:TPR repeat protein